MEVYQWKTITERIEKKVKKTKPKNIYHPKASGGTLMALGSSFWMERKWTIPEKW
jgi:hypothetical protein